MRSHHGHSGRVRTARWVLALLALTSCVGDQQSLTAPIQGVNETSQLYGTPKSVTVDPATVTASVGDSGAFTATVRDRRGRVLSNAVTWASSDTTVVIVRPDGFALAVGVGSIEVSARSGNAVGSSQVTIIGDTTTPPPPPPPTPSVATVIVSPGSAAGNVGDSAQFAATAQDSSGATIEGLPVAWSSTNTAVVVVSASGMGRAVGAGTASLVATIDGVVGHSAITVFDSATPPPPPPPPAPVASVTIAPANPSMMIASGVQLTATLRDASGNVLSDRNITWSSSNFLVATVSTSGYVTAALAGSTTITATSEGISDATTATVTALPPPPEPSGSWPNMPGTYSVLSDQPFNPSIVPGWELIWNTSGSITSNSTAPFSAPSVFEVQYPAGFVAGTAPATQIYPLGLQRNLYIGMWWKANSNWQGHESAVNKLQFVFTDAGGNLYLGAYGPPGGPYELRILLQFSGADTRDWLRPNVSSGVVTMGDWHKIEWLMEYQTSGANGVIKWYLDGQLVGDYRDVTFPSQGFVEYKLSPTWGGVGGISKQQTDYFWFDHVTIGRR